MMSVIGPVQSRYREATYNFRKVVRRHTKDRVANLWQIYFSIQQWKNFEISLRTDKVIIMSLVFQKSKLFDVW